MRIVRVGFAPLLLSALLSLGVMPVGADETPPHYDGERFFNPWGRIERPGWRVKLPFVFRRLLGSLRMREGAPARVANDGSFLRANSLHSQPTVTWVGHSTLVVQMDGVTFVTDPIWSDTASPLAILGPRRLVPPGIAIDALPPVDFVVVSHSHYDHTDIYSLRRLADKGAQIFVPLGLDRLLRRSGIERVSALDWWEEAKVGKVTVHCLPAKHSSGRGVGDLDRTLWAGWAVRGPTRSFYYTGDTGYFVGFAEIGARLGPFDLAAVPIGAYEPRVMMRDVHLTPEQALEAALDARAKVAVGIHYGTFDLTDEPLGEPPLRFHRHAMELGLAPDRVWTLAIGETRTW